MATARPDNVEQEIEEMSMTVAEAAEAFGANATQTPGAPRVAIGCPGSSAALHVWCSGWTGGVSPASPPDRGPGTCPLAGVVAGALAISEVFLAHRQARADAGRRPVQLSLWNPGAEVDEGPPLRYLPTNLWLLGLGNLGQAYLWALSMLVNPARRPQRNCTCATSISRAQRCAATRCPPNPDRVGAQGA